MVADRNRNAGNLTAIRHLLRVAPTNSLPAKADMRKLQFLLILALSTVLTSCVGAASRARRSGETIGTSQVVRSNIGLCFWQDIRFIGPTVYPGKLSVGNPSEQTRFQVEIRYQPGADINRIVTKPHTDLASYPTISTAQDGQIRRFNPKTGHGWPVEYFAVKQLPKGAATLRFQSPQTPDHALDRAAWSFAQKWWDTVKVCGTPSKRTFSLPTESDTTKMSTVTLPRNGNACPSRAGAGRLRTEEHLGSDGAIRCLYGSNSITLTKRLITKATSFASLVTAYLAKDEFMTTNISFGLKGSTAQDVCDTVTGPDYVFARCAADEAFRFILFVKRGNRIQVTTKTSRDTDMVLPFLVGIGSNLSYNYDYLDYISGANDVITDNPKTSIVAASLPCPKSTWC